MKTYKMLGQFHVANLAQADVDTRQANALQRDWDRFTQDILAEGLYESDYRYYAMVFLRYVLCRLLGNWRAIICRGLAVASRVPCWNPSPSELAIV